MKPSSLLFEFPVSESDTDIDDIAAGPDFPEDKADKLAYAESFNKHLFRPNSYLHKWWARRCGTTFRYILKMLVDDPRRRDFYIAGGLEGKIILDPMMGGGTTLHEALRMGANVIGYDIDPIPVLQTKVSLSPCDVPERQEIFINFMKKLQAEMNDFFSCNCPSCGANAEIQYILHGAKYLIDNKLAVVVDGFLLREERDGANLKWMDFYPDKKTMIDGFLCEIVEKKSLKGHKNAGVVTDVLHWQRFAALLIVGHCSKCGQFRKKPDDNDDRVKNNAIKKLERIKNILPTDDFIHNGPKSRDLLRRGISRYSELFSPRQLLYLLTAQKTLMKTPDKHRSWLGLLISASLEFNCMLCGYKGVMKNRPGTIRHVFSHHAYSFPYTALENNPIFSRCVSGSLRQLFNRRIRVAGEWAKRPIERLPIANGWKKVFIDGETDSGVNVKSPVFNSVGGGFFVEQRDSSEIALPNDSVDFIVTDPPYFDSVQYGDLSRFFRCWLAWLLPEAENWHYQDNKAAVAGNNGDFRHTLGNIWRESVRVLKRPHGRLVFTYHHWRSSAWADLSLSLRHAGFQLCTAYVTHSENIISVHIRSLKALKHDAILVLQPCDYPALIPGHWKLPTVIPDDSQGFCRACIQILGWCLENNLADNDIADVWTKYLDK